MPVPPAEISYWPLQIYTFGRFSLLRDGVPVTFTGKVQHRPLELLKALIALGGRDVAKTVLSDHLWPNTAEEEAHQSFTVTLHRLRRLLGNSRFIELKDGRVTLDPCNCWVDVWAFERLAGQAETLLHANLQGETALTAFAAAQQAIEHYRGDFLAAEADRPWSQARRERLRSRLLRLVGMVGRMYEEQGAWDQAVACYLHGLVANELAEELYQQLMNCYRKMGRHGEIASTFQRCRVNLALKGIKPSARTKAIYEGAAFED